MSPRATYRVQFHAGFTFADAEEQAAYWADLGISHIYASPIAAARAGSQHGYDVIDPGRINPELGGEEGFRSLCAKLRTHGLGVILDIVPNHVAVGGQDNLWWLDLLENGQASAFARYFDIDWASPDPWLDGKVLAPFLGAPYGEALATGALRLDAEPALDRLSVLAHDTHRFPLRRADYADVLGLLGVSDIGAVTPQAIEASFGQAPQARRRLHALLERQHYRLAWWRTAGDAINWRRFFDINELAGLRIEEPEVFDAVHALPLELYASGLIDGLRIDHVDGLADPSTYLRRLRSELLARDGRRGPGAAPRAYLVVEKILAPGESLPADWPVDGTTGYDFMNEVSALLHDPRGAEPLSSAWRRLSGRPAEFEAEEEAARAEVLSKSFAGQLDALARSLRRAVLNTTELGDLTLPALRRAAVAMIKAMRAYRTYASPNGAPQSDAPTLRRAVAAACAAQPGDAVAINVIARWLGGEDGEGQDRADAVRRFQQLCAPIAAKAVEDTAFYRYGRLLSRNDVGFDPGRLSSMAPDFLAASAERAKRFPHAMLATATHDHKRGEDVRARLSVLSEAPAQWTAQVESWLGPARTFGVAPGDAHMLVQMIVGAWPLDLTAGDAKGRAAFCERLTAWQTKALREAKLATSWSSPDPVYEAACANFLRHVLLSPDAARGRERLMTFIEEIARAGAAKSLVQAGLKLTLPGVPDIYQGAEFWDFSLVDPDNRRPVDYCSRRQALDRSPGGWREGSVKQGLICSLLHLRRDHPQLFAHGQLEPLALKGGRASSALAFRRRFETRSLLVLAVLRTFDLRRRDQGVLVDADWWEDTVVMVEPGSPRPAHHISAGRVFTAQVETP